MTGEKGQALVRVKKIYDDRSGFAKGLKTEGKKVLGYLCIYPVLEMITAFDLVPYRIFGNIAEPITEADSCLPTIVCPFLRSAMDLGLKHEYDFLDGVVMCHSCEVGEKMAHIWRTYLRPDYFHFIDVPHTVRKSAQAYFKTQLKEFQKHLETFTGKQLSIDRLRRSIHLYNQQRALIRELYDLRKLDPPLISGTETLEVAVALMSIPVEQGNELTRQVIQDIKERKNGPNKQPVRLLVWGSILDNTTLIEMIENSGANVVIDDTCVGSRAFHSDVELTDDPLDGLAYRYLVGVRCPRTFRAGKLDSNKKDYLTDLESRFGYLREFIKEWKVNGVILESIRYCDIHGYEVPGIRDYLGVIGIPNIYLEHDYSKAALAPLKTRVQGLIELIGLS